MNKWEPFDITNPEHQDRSKYNLKRGTVYDHVIAAVRASQSNDPVTNLAILFHDVQKGITAVQTDKGTSFPGHENPNLGLFQKIASRLKFSNKEKEAILFAMTHHMLGHQIKTLSKSKVLKMRQNPNWEVLKHTMRADDASRGEPLFNPKEFHERMAYIEQIHTQFGETAEFERKMSALITGKTIMDLIPGIKGADIGRIKNATRDYITSKEFNVTPEEIQQYIISQSNSTK